MFKKGVLVLACVLTIAGCATQQFKPVETTNVVNVPSQGQKEIYNKARQWFSQYFVSGKSVVDYENQEEGTIIGNGIANIGSDPFGLIQYKIKYNIRIDTKEGKFRALTKINEHTNTDSKSTYSVSYVSKEREADAINHVNTIVADIESYLNDKKLDSKSEW
ncbi:DUF4468 domain-containing protein [Pseudomonadota bacterium]